jgi:Fur family transcriptional regulator, peroxide stress response regulator
VLNETFNVFEIFSDRGVRCTNQRRAVFEELVSLDTHPTADELFEVVRKRMPAISLATVYNALGVFTENGLCRRIPGSRALGGCRYDADVSDHVHVCLSDGTMRDAPTHLSEQIVQSIPRSLVEELEDAMGVRFARLSVRFETRPESEQADGSLR